MHIVQPWIHFETNFDKLRWPVLVTNVIDASFTD